MLALVYPELGNRGTHPPALPEALLDCVQRGSSCCSLPPLLLLTSPNTTILLPRFCAFIGSSTHRPLRGLAVSMSAW